VTPRIRRLLLVAALTTVALNPFLFVGSFAGDAEVHLVFAENASHGRFFEFNPGERVSGETSPGYMLLGALLFRMFPARIVPVALKLLGISAWYLLCWVAYRVAARTLKPSGMDADMWPAAAAIAAALHPGSVYNATVGMENGLFALVVWLWLDRAREWEWLEARAAVPIAREVMLSVLLGLSFWIRPEGLLVALSALAFRSLFLRTPLVRSLFALAITMVFVVASLLFQYAYTGDIVATSILSRRILAASNGIRIGGFTIDPTFAERLVLYAPLTLFFALGLRRGFSSLNGTARYLVWLFGSCFAFYTLGGAPHLARYLIFVIPVLFFGASYGARMVWEQSAKGRALVVIASIVMLVGGLLETRARRGIFSQRLLKEAMAAPALRREHTDAFISAVGGVDKRPVILACESIQQRYALDNRVLIRSTDGRTDRAFFSFVHDGKIDYIGYLKYEHADVLDEAPIRDGRPTKSTIFASLEHMPVGHDVVKDGLRFRRLPSGQFAMTNDAP
jgi:hypothetical protein